MAAAPADKPFRIKPHRATEDERQAWARQYTRQEEQTIKEVQSQIKASGQGIEDPADKLAGWAQHPDERVQMTLIKQADRIRDNYPESRKQINRLLYQLYRQACQQAQQEKACWTPVLDRMAASDETPSPKQRTEMDDEFAQLSSFDKLGPLKTWIQQRDNPRLLGALFNFKATEPLQYVARFAPSVDDRLREVLMERDTCLAASLATNQQLSARQQEKLLDWAIQQFQPNGPGRVIHLQDARVALLNLEKQGAIEAAQLSQLLIETLDTRSKSDLKAGARAQYTVEVPRAQYAVEVLTNLEVPESELLAFEKAFQATSSILRKLMKHPQAGSAYYRWVGQAGGLGTRVALSQQEAACQDPKVREMLKQDRQNKSILYNLTRTARGEEFDALFSELVQSFPQAGVYVVKEGIRAEDSPVEARHLTLLLKHTEDTTRRKALRVAKQFRQHETNQPSQATEGAMSLPNKR